MKTNIRGYLDNLRARGVISFTTEEYINASGVSEIAALHALNRMRRKKFIFSPVRGFHVILDPADRKNGSRSPEEFIDYLMHHMQEPYYVAMLSAAEIYGAGHHRPQQFQVMLNHNRRSISSGLVKIKFIAKTDIEKFSTLQHKVKTGYVKVATPEVTALDLVAYPKHAAGLDNVATVLNELAESLVADKLIKVAALYELPVVQRLGYILEQLGKEKLVAGLNKNIAKKLKRAVPLLAGKKSVGRIIDKKWGIIVNEKLEPDL